MRDLLAALVALVLLALALGLLVTLQLHRQRRLSARARARSLGRRVVAEVPAGPDLTLFTEDDTHLFYGTRAIDKTGIRAVRVLVNHSPIAATVSARYPDTPREIPASFEDPSDGLARDRWDVAIDTADGPIVIECGAIRERISQELARTIYDSASLAVRTLDARALTTPSPPRRRGD